MSRAGNRILGKLNEYTRRGSQQPKEREAETMRAMKATEGRQPTFEFPNLNPDERLGELMLYIVDRCKADARLGATKLNKILYWADFFAYANTGTPVTGAGYMRLPQGPVPRRLVPVRDSLVSKGDLVVSERRLFNGRTQTQFLANRPANLRLFTAEQLAIVDSIIDYIRDRTAAEVSEETHNRVWRIAKEDREPIPYEAVFISDRKPVAFHFDAAKRILADAHATAGI